MQLHFEMSGGYGGLFAARPLTCVVAVDELPESERAHLRTLVDASGLLEAEHAEARATAGRDVVTYRLTITTEGTTRRFSFDDVSVPPAARPLLQHLQQRALAERPRRG